MRYARMLAISITVETSVSARRDDKYRYATIATTNAKNRTGWTYL